jgi:hypothetical protein
VALKFKNVSPNFPAFDSKNLKDHDACMADGGADDE